jgi:hypothetical protein
VPVNVKVLLAVNVLPLAIVNVADVAGAVMATLLTLVADATPNVGVTSVGLVANTKEPEPVSLVTADAKLALEGVAKNVATPDAKPLIPVDTGSPVQLVNVPLEGVPRAPPFTTNAPELPTLTAKAVPTFVPSPVIPAMGNPVQLVNVPDVGVPNAPPLANSVAVPVGTVSVEVPDVVNVKLCAADIVSVEPEIPTLVMLCALLSSPFFATKRFVVAMILCPLGC